MYINLYDEYNDQNSKLILLTAGPFLRCLNISGLSLATLPLICLFTVSYVFYLRMK